MVYNHLKDKVKTFLQPFAESGQAVGAEDIKAYFEKLRGDAEAIKAAGGAAVGNAEEKDGDGKGDSRREQSGKLHQQPGKSFIMLTRWYRLLACCLVSWVFSEFCRVGGSG